MFNGFHAAGIGLYAVLVPGGASEGPNPTNVRSQTIRFRTAHLGTAGRAFFAGQIDRSGQLDQADVGGHRRSVSRSGAQGELVLRLLFFNRSDSDGYEFCRGWGSPLPVLCAVR